MPTPVLTDPSGVYTIGGQTTLTPYEVKLLGNGATHILTGPQGGFRGVYVDNETPNRDAVATTLRGEIGPGGIVVVALYPSEEGHTVPGCICALEWYPVGGGYWGVPLPKAEAYITQWFFSYPNKKPPTVTQREQLYNEALSHDPKLAWIY